MIFRLFGNMRESSMMLQKQSDTMLANNYNSDNFSVFKSLIPSWHGIKSKRQIQPPFFPQQVPESFLGYFE